MKTADAVFYVRGETYFTAGLGHSRGYLLRLRLTNKLTRLTVYVGSGTRSGVVNFIVAIRFLKLYAHDPTSLHFVPFRFSSPYDNSKNHQQKLVVFTIVPGAGLEPARFFNRQRILSPSCLPFHHPGTEDKSGGPLSVWERESFNSHPRGVVPQFLIR